MNAEDRLKCDCCGEDHFNTVIIEKPVRFAFNTRIHKMVDINNEGRKDNFCINCLVDEIEQLKECY
ncbi:MAG: hypothetical protein IJ880_04710 [Bacilli bacterium]|nr:hypothetical protein [Bacilli bacterium]MBR3119723.1 hypothetical protein [Oceanobacillus sp.]